MMIYRLPNGDVGVHPFYPLIHLLCSKGLHLFNKEPRLTHKQYAMIATSMICILICVMFPRNLADRGLCTILFFSIQWFLVNRFPITTSHVRAPVISSVIGFDGLLACDIMLRFTAVSIIASPIGVDNPAIKPLLTVISALSLLLAFAPLMNATIIATIKANPNTEGSQRDELNFKPQDIFYTSIAGVFCIASIFAFSIDVLPFFKT
jgi:hypothetical protein